MKTHPRIALIHATTIAVDPIKAALAAGWPEADAVNILDDSLSPDRAEAGEVDEGMTGRIVDLTRYARRIGSDGILFTCSAFGAAIETAAKAVDVPVLRPNEAMFEAAMQHGSRSAMIYTFPPSREGMEQEFYEEAARIAPEATLASFLAPDAIDALRTGDTETHNRLVAELAATLSGYDAIALAHFSTSRAAEAVRNVTDIPVLTSPDAAVAKLRRLVCV